MRIEIPFEGERIDGHTVRRATGLKNPEYGHGVHGVFKFPPQKAGAERVCQHPAIAPANRPHSGVRRDTLHTVSAWTADAPTTANSPNDRNHTRNGFMNLDLRAGRSKSQ